MNLLGHFSSLMYSIYLNHIITSKLIVNGGWTDFGDWGVCSETCESGFRVRTRTCTNPAPSGGGENCVGSATEAEVCVDQPCPGSVVVY